MQVVNLSVGGEAIQPLAGNPVDEAVAVLVPQGIVVVTAAGNDGQRRLVPPATAPEALTIGGLDDHNTFSHEELDIWHSNYGLSLQAETKPELVAPSIWVVAPLLPGSDIAHEAKQLFDRRATRVTVGRASSSQAESRLTELKLVTPDYQHVEGTSFAAPLVSSLIACMLEANPRLTPSLVRTILLAASQPVAGAAPERQGAGAVDAGQAEALALREEHGPLARWPVSPYMTPKGILYILHEHNAEQVQVLGSWNAWLMPGLAATEVEPGIWEAFQRPLMPGRYLYKFLVNRSHWLDDPSNPCKTPDGSGGFNSVLENNYQ